jgi:hypothetical protein
MKSLKKHVLNNAKVLRKCPWISPIGTKISMNIYCLIVDLLKYHCKRKYKFYVDM